MTKLELKKIAHIASIRMNWHCHENFQIYGTTLFCTTWAALISLHIRFLVFCFPRVFSNRKLTIRHIIGSLSIVNNSCTTLLVIVKIIYVCAAAAAAVLGAGRLQQKIITKVYATRAPADLCILFTHVRYCLFRKFKYNNLTTRKRG